MTSNQPYRSGTTNRRVDPFAAFALAWPTLSADETDDALAELEDWIDWLRDRYHLDHRHLPHCWALHSELIEELSALHTAWQHSSSHKHLRASPTNTCTSTSYFSHQSICCQRKHVSTIG